MADDNEGGPLDAQRLMTIIERWERLEEEKKALATDQKEIMDEAKASGFDPKLIKIVISYRKKDREKLEQEHRELEVYLHAVGIDL